MRFWREKLKRYREATISRALMSGRWQFFPSVDDVITEIERIQAQPNDFVPCHECVNGWIVKEAPSDVYKSGKQHQAVRCQCWHEWACK